jgi:hypothetical protein
MGTLPRERDDSANKIISAQLDHTNEFLKKCRFKDALAHTDTIGTDLSPFDRHQKARWYLQRGLCIWLSSDDDTKEATKLFHKAAELYPDDDRMAAASVRALILDDDIDGALGAAILHKL